jgi:hypothetical protein
MPFMPAAVGVDREPAADLDGAVGDEAGCLATTAEPELLELHQHVGREVVVEDGGLDVGRS